MSKARQKRLQEAKIWFEAQNFTEDSHVVKAYRKKFNVDNICAMRELCMLKVLSPEKQKAYEERLLKRQRKRQRKKEPQMDFNPDQDERFFFIAGYTSGGVPYGVTWEEEAAIEGITEDELRQRYD